MSSRAEMSSSLTAMAPSGIRALANLALGMDDVLPLYFGESSTPTPGFIVESAVQALRSGRTFYSENAGLPALRAEIAAHYARHHSVTVDPDTEVVVTASGLQALHLALRAVINPGDDVLVLSPAWPNGAGIVELSHGRPVPVGLVLGPDGYAIDFSALDAVAGPRARALVLTSPSNPLGWVASVEDQRRLLAFCRERGMWLIADEVYERISYAGAPGDPVPSVLRLADRGDPVIVVQSFSKSYCMTGWRVGWLVAPAEVGPVIADSNELFTSHAATFSQVAAITALAEGDAFIAQMVAGYRENRDLCHAALAALPGVTVPRPEGAFYLFPTIDGLEDSTTFCRDLLVAERVGIAPGAAFGEDGEGSVRICYAADARVLEPAMERLTRFLAAG